MSARRAIYASGSSATARGVAGTRTNLRIDGLIRERLDVGGGVEVDLAADGARVSSRGPPIPVDLADKAMRRLLESAAVVDTVAADGLELLNL